MTLAHRGYSQVPVGLSPKIEVGTLFGFSHLSHDIGWSANVLGVPSPGYRGLNISISSLYLSWSPIEQLALGPEVAIGRSSNSEVASYSYLAGRGAFFPQGSSMSGLYILGLGAIGVTKHGERSHTEFIAGFGLGNQWRQGPAFSLRVEGQYRRQFEGEVHDFSLIFGLGTREQRLDTDSDRKAPTQEVEIGTLFGLSRLSSDGGSVTMIGVPVPPIIYFPSIVPSLSVSWFPSEKVTLGPEFSFGRISIDYGYDDDDDYDLSDTTFYLGCRSAFFPKSNSMPGPYMLGLGAWAVTAHSGAPLDIGYSNYSAGFGLGYQWFQGTSFVLRSEGRYRRWFDPPINELALIFGLGTRLGGARNDEEGALE